MLPFKFCFIWPSGFRGENFEQELSMTAMFIYGSGQNEQSVVSNTPCH
jgi:hypothetical protein